MLRQEVQMLQQQMNAYAPLADMVPNFASEWLGMVPQPPAPGCLVIPTHAGCFLTWVLYLHRRQNHPWIILSDIFAKGQRDTERNIFLFIFIKCETGCDPGKTRWLHQNLATTTRVQSGYFPPPQEQTPLHPGNCWCFSGGQGHLVVSLAQPAAISHVTIGHISKSQSPTGNTSSAPRKFSVYVSLTFFVSHFPWKCSGMFALTRASSSPRSGYVEHKRSWSVSGNCDLQHRRPVVPDIKTWGE